MFTGLGAVIVAVTGLITALYTTGVIGSKANPNAVPPANASAALAASPPANSADSDRYKTLAGQWEVTERPSRDFDGEKKVTWRYEAAVSGNVLTLTGKVLAIGVDKNLSEDEERIAATFVTTLIGSSGVGEYRVKRYDGNTVVNDATIRLSDDLKQFEGKFDSGGKIHTLTGRKL
jgi:hypothetical protein